MKKIGIIAGISCVVLLLGYVLLILFGALQVPSFLKKEETMTDMERIKQVIEKSIPTDVVIRGEDIMFEDGLEHRNIGNINEQTLETKKEYQVVIINDLNNEISLSNEEITYMKEKIGQNDTMLLYLGRNYATTFDAEEKESANISGNLGFTYYSIDGEPKRNIGCWDESIEAERTEYPDSLGSTVLYVIEDYLNETK